MNKKGIFVTLTSVIILIMIVFLIQITAEESRHIGDVNVEYTKHKQVVKYLTQVEDIYLPNMVTTSEKYALIGISNFTNQHPNNIELAENLTGAVMTGHTDNNPNNAFTQVSKYPLPKLLNETFGTISGSIVFEEFDYVVRSIEQNNEWTITVNSTVFFELQGRTQNWRDEANITWTNAINFSNDLTVVGMISPLSGYIVTQNWVVNHTSLCMLRLLDDDYSCSVDGVCPHSVFGGCLP